VKNALNQNRCAKLEKDNRKYFS